MERFNRLAVVHTILLLSGLGALPSRGQAPSSEPKAAPVADAPSSPKPAKPSRKSPTVPEDLRLPINLATALRLADAPPLIVTAAQAGSWIAEAKLQKAKLPEVPTLNRRGVRFALAEANFFFQPEPGGPLLPTPQMLRSTDKIFQPLRERQVVNSSRRESQAAKNDALLQTAKAYFNVHKIRGIYAGSLDVVRKGRNLLEVIDHLSRDLVPEVEIDRARNFLAFLEQQAVSARKD